MDVWQITVAALRRWYILLPLIALTGFATYTVGDNVRPQYDVTATVILVPGTAESEIASPYGSRENTTGVLTILLDNTESRASIADRDLNPDYVTDARSRSPIIDFSVRSDTPELGLATGEAVLELASQELAERQDAVGIPSNAQIGMQVLQAPSVSAVVTDGKMRNMAIVGILGAAVSLLTAVLFDDIVGLIRRRLGNRRERRAAQSAASEIGQAVEVERQEAEHSSSDSAPTPSADGPRAEGAPKDAGAEVTR